MSLIHETKCKVDQSSALQIFYTYVNDIYNNNNLYLYNI